MKASKNKLPEPQKNVWWPYALLAGFVVLFFWDGIFAHKTFCLRDEFIQILTWPPQIWRALPTHEIFPLWNPFRGFGKPFIADPEQGFFYPISWLYYVLPPAKALVIFCMLQIYIVGASIYALARHWKLTVFPALLSAVCLMFSTWVIASMDFRSLFSAFIWGPLELLLISSFIERTHAEGRLKIWENLLPIVLLAVVMTLQYLPGYPQSLFFMQIVVGAYMVTRCWYLKSREAFFVTAKFCLVAGLITAGLCMAQFLPSMEFVKLSERGVQIDPGLDMASMHPRHLLTLIFPYLFGRAGYPHEYWATTIYEFWIGTCYIGIIPVLLLVFAPFCLRKSFRDDSKPFRFLFLFFVGIAVFGLLMAMGKYLPFYMFFSTSVPGFNHFRWPSKFLVFVLYSMSIIAGLGYQVLLDARGNPVRVRQIKLAFGICGALLAGVLIANAMAGGGKEVFGSLTAGSFVFTAEHVKQALADFRWALIFMVAGFAALLAALSKSVRPQTGGLILICIAFFNLWIISRQIHPIMDDKIYEYEPKIVGTKLHRMELFQVHSMFANIGQFLYGNHDPAAWEWAKEAGTNSTLQPFGIFHTFQDGLKLQRHLVLFQILGQLPSNEQGRLADILGIRYLITGENPEQILWGNLPRRVDVIERPSALPKAYLVDRWHVVKDIMDGTRQLVDPLFDPRREAVIEPENLPFPSEFETSTSGSEKQEVSSIQYTWDTVELKVDASHRSLLVLNDTWYPGWIATVDGLPQPIIRTNLNFRGIFIEKGSHQVKFRYDPWQFRVGLAVTLSTLAVVLILLAWRYRHLLRGAPNPTPTDTKERPTTKKVGGFKA